MNLPFIPYGKSLKVLFEEFQSITESLRPLISGKYRFLILDTKSETDSRELSSFFKDVPYFRIPKPYEEYVWHEPFYFSRVEGLTFEREIVSVIKSVLISSFAHN